MKIALLLPVAGALALSASAFAGTIDFSGNLHAASLTGFDWVGGSKMWGGLETGSFTGSAQSGFGSIITNPALLTFTFGDLELTDHGIPGASTPGFEVYTEGDSSVQPFQVFYNGVLWASGTSVFLRTDVDNNADFNAVGTGQAVLTSAGVDSAFYDAVMSQTGNTGVLNMTISAFFPVNAIGDFSSTGTLSTAAIPEPATVGVIVGACVLAGVAAVRRKPSQARPWGDRSQPGGFVPGA